MAKINFTKVDIALRDSINKKFIQELSRLGTLADLMNEKGGNKIAEEEAAELLIDFQKELRRIRASDTEFYDSLEVTKQLEDKLFAETPSLDRSDWAFLQGLQHKIDGWKKTLKKREPNTKDVQEVEAARKKQKNARFNVNPKWTPL